MQHPSTWIAGLALLAAGAVSALSWQRVSAQEQRLAQLREEVAGRAIRLPEPEAWRGSVDELREQLASLSGRVESLVHETRRPLDEADGTADRRRVDTATRDAAKETGPDAQSTDAGKRELERRELAQLFEALLGPDGQLAGDPAEVARFWELAKGTSAIDDWMGDLEAQVELDPRNADLRMDLADAYVAKLYTTSGPEQGRWGGMAEEQWSLAAELDPGHWEANFALGNNYAYYPDVMDRTGDAIERLERARQIQEREAPLARHVQTYLLLSRLYRRQGDLDQAQSVLEAGILRHPEAEGLREALEELR